MTDRPIWHYSLAMWVVLGLIDGLVTVGAVAFYETTTVESNPLLRAHLLDALNEFQTTESYLAYWQPLALKLAVVGAAASLLPVAARAAPRRTVAGFALTLTGTGVVVVVNNLYALRSFTV